MKTIKYKIGEKLQRVVNGRLLLCHIGSVTETHAKIVFSDGTSANFPWYWVVRDFQRYEGSIQ